MTVSQYTLIRSLVPRLSLQELVDLKCAVQQIIDRRSCLLLREKPFAGPFLVSEQHPVEEEGQSHGRTY